LLEFLWELIDCKVHRIVSHRTTLARHRGHESIFALCGIGVLLGGNALMNSIFLERLECLNGVLA